MGVRSSWRSARPPTRAKQAIIGLDEGIGRASRERSPQKTRAGVPRFPRPQRREACRADAHGTRPPSPLVRAKGERTGAQRRPDEAMRKWHAAELVSKESRPSGSMRASGNPARAQGIRRAHVHLWHWTIGAETCGV